MSGSMSLWKNSKVKYYLWNSNTYTEGQPHSDWGLYQGRPQARVIHDYLTHNIKTFLHQFYLKHK